MSTSLVRLMVAPILALALVAAYTGFSAFAQDLVFTNAQTELSFWGRDNYQPEPKTIKHTGQVIHALLQSAPGHPDYRGLQANYAAWLSYWSENMEDRASFNSQAVQNQYIALQSRPAHRHSWTKLVEYASRTTTGEARLTEARAHLRALSVAEVPATLPEQQPHPI